MIFDGLNGTLFNADWIDVFDATLFDINVILISKMNNYFERDENCQGFIKREKYTYQS